MRGLHWATQAVQQYMQLSLIHISTIASASDLEGKTIGVQLGTTGDFIVEDIPDATASQYNKGVDAVNDLINGRVDACLLYTSSKDIGQLCLLISTGDTGTYTGGDH